MRLVLSLVSILLFFCSANAGVLGNLFNDFASLACVDVEDKTSEHPETITYKFATPNRHPAYFSSYQSAVASFVKKLPQKYNKGKIADGTMEVYFSQPSSTSNGEAITVIYVPQLGLTFVNYILMSPKEALKYKAELQKSRK